MTYAETSLIENPSINLFQEMGWDFRDCFQENVGAQSELGRQSRHDVILFTRLKAALEEINPGVHERALTEAIDEMARDRSAMSAVMANKEVYGLLKNGYTYRAQHEGDEDQVVQYIDWRNVFANDFLLCSQMTIRGDSDAVRPDLMGFVNGLPLVLIELKTSHKNLLEAYDDNLMRYRRDVPQLFHYNQLIILSNGGESVVGALTTDWGNFSHWKKIDREDEPRRISAEVVFRGTCARDRLLDLIENFILFVEEDKVYKIVAKYHQYLGVNQALEGLKDIRQCAGQLGVFWHTQGSGKSYSMMFFCQKAFRKFAGNWTFVVITDRTDLDRQIHTNFDGAGMLEEHCQAKSAEHLRQLLAEDHRYIFTLIQKFKVPKGESFPELSLRDDIIVIVDEAHRSQYDVLAMNMRKAIPNAGFIAFTGTPLLGDNDKTRDVFGEYVSVYNFSDAIEDGATLALFYENRVPEVNLKREDIGSGILEIMDDAELSEEQEARLEREFARNYQIITRDDRLNTIAEDIVEQFVGREYQGKAMVVSIDKATAIRMYDKVQFYWKEKIGQLKRELPSLKPGLRAQQEAQIALMESTNMAVVVSDLSKKEIERLAKKNLDAAPHALRLKKEKLDECFKAADHPLRIVFVCGMWTTGFDVKTVSTLYLDKPLKSHTLMQTIARANRVAPGKPSGQVIDYIDVLDDLRTALGVYGRTAVAGVELDSPAQNKVVLLEHLARAFNELDEFLDPLDINLLAIHEADCQGFEKGNLIDQAVEILLEPAYKADYIAFVRQINRIFKGVLPDVRAEAFLPQRVAMNVIYAAMLNKTGFNLASNEVLDGVREQVAALLDEAIVSVKMSDHFPVAVDLSKLNFEDLGKMVEDMQGPRPSQVELLQNTISRRLTEMVARNSTRYNLQEKFQELIHAYNLGSIGTEEQIRRLQGFIQTMTVEEKRSTREELTEDEQAIFDLLVKEIELKPKERDQVKLAARHLLRKIKQFLVIDWQKKQQAKALVQEEIKIILDGDLPDVYTPELWSKSCDVVFSHIYDRYGYGAAQY